MNRAPGSIWLMRYPGTYPNGYTRTDVDDQIEIVYLDSADTYQLIRLSRKDARLLAKRVNQCLDATVKK